MRMKYSRRGMILMSIFNYSHMFHVFMYTLIAVLLIMEKGLYATIYL